jgi:hypothetical protein
MKCVALASVVGAAAVALAGPGCGNPGLPAYDTSRPKPLQRVGPPRDATTVRIAMKPLPWWTVAGGRDAFVLGFDASSSRPAPPGARIGGVRSRDIELADHVFEAVRCAWLTVPMGESRPCPRTSRTEAMAIARDAITEARAELRAHVADAGADAVADVRCFAERDADRARVWCEGTAIASALGQRIAREEPSLPTNARAEPRPRVVTNEPDPTAPFGHEPAPSAPHAAPIDRTPAPSEPHAAPSDREPAPSEPDPAAPIDHEPAPSEPDPAAPIDHEPQLTETRFVLFADASVGMLGKRPIVGSTLGLRYRPLEFGFYILDLQRESLAPRDDGVVGIGVTTLYRIALGDSRADALIGGSALIAAVNNTTNPQFDRLYHGFGGIAYQTPWRIAGAAQPFVQLRAGAAYGGVIASRVLPMLELHVGLTSPERR